MNAPPSGRGICPSMHFAGEKSDVAFCRTWRSRRCWLALYAGTPGPASLPILTSQPFALQPCSLLTRIECIGSGLTHERQQALFDRFSFAGDGWLNYEYFAYAVFGKLPAPDSSPLLRHALSSVRGAMSRAGLTSLVDLETELLRSAGTDGRLPRAVAKAALRTACGATGSRSAVADHDIEAVLVETMRPTAQYAVISGPDLLFMLRGALPRRRRAAIDAVWTALGGDAGDASSSVTTAALQEAFGGAPGLTPAAFNSAVSDVCAGADSVSRDVFVALWRAVSPLCSAGGDAGFEALLSAAFPGTRIEWTDKDHLIPGTSLHHMAATGGLGTRTFAMKLQTQVISEAVGVPVALNQPLAREFAPVALAPVLGATRLIDNTTSRSVFGASGVTGSTRGIGLGVSSRLTGLAEVAPTVSVATVRPVSASTLRRY